MRASILFSLTFMSVLHLIFGLYIEDNNNIVAHIIYGEFGPVGNDMYINDYHFFQMPIFYKISRILPNVPFYGLWYFFHGVIALTGIVYALKKTIYKSKQSFFKSLIIILLLFIFFTQNFVFFHQIKISILLGFSGVILTDVGINQKNTNLYWAGFFIFLLGLILRMHSPVLVLLLCLLIKVIIERRVIFTFKQYFIHIFFSILFITTYQLYGLYITNAGKYFEANYEYTVLEKNSLIDEKVFKNKKDSIKYIGMQEFFLSDSSEFTIDYFKETLTAAPEVEKSFGFQNIKHAITEMNDKLFKNWILIFITFVCVFLFLINCVKKNNHLRNLFIISIVAYSIPFCLLLFLVDEMKMRFISPYLVIWSILCIREVWNFNNLKNWQKIFLFISLTFAASIELKKVYTSTINEKNLNKERFESAKALYEYSKKHSLISFVRSDMPLVSAFFHRNPTAYFQNIAYFDAGYLTYFSYAHDQFYNLFGVSPLDYPSVIELLKTNKDLRLYATEERLSLIKDYFKIVYEYDFKYELIDDQPELNLNGKIYKVID